MSNHPFQADFVELIVREVIRRLRENGVTVTASNGAVASGAMASGRSEPTKAPSAMNVELAVTERVVTLETLRDRLHGIQRVAVAKKAIVTPAVRDELKHKKIELIRK